jgi:hypothetical protein
MLGARRAERLQQAVAAIRTEGGSADAIVMDVTSEPDVQRLVDAARALTGRLDIMVCNAGFGYYGTVEQTPPDVMKQMMDVNFMGTYLGARAAVPLFRQQGEGHLIVVSSIVGRRGIAEMSGYTATKAAQVGFVESLRTEFVGTNMERDYGHSVRGLGPKQSAGAVAAAVVRCLRRPVAEVYPHTKSRGLTILNALAPGFTDSLVRKYGRRREQ